jgi:tetratricopeptide (TPR) repeat protein
LTFAFLHRLTKRLPFGDARFETAPSATTSIALLDLYDVIEAKLALGELKSAAALATIVWQAFPTDLRANVLLGRTLLALESWQEASARFELALQLDPDDAASQSMLGVAHWGAGRSREAIRSFERALALNPDDDEARASLKQLRGEQRDEPPVHLPPLGEIQRLLAAGELAAALRNAEEQRRQYPGDLSLAVLRLEALWRLGRVAEAERAGRGIMVRSPSALKPRLILGSMQTADHGPPGQDRELAWPTTDDDLSGLVAARLGLDLEPTAATLTIDVPADLLEAGGAHSVDLLHDVDDPDHPPTSDALKPAERRDASEATTPELAAPTEREDVPEAAEAAPVVAAGRPCLIAVTVRRAVIGRYGLEGLERLERRLAAVRRELNLLGLTFEIALVDDAASMAEFELPAVKYQRQDEIRSVIQALARQVFNGPRAPARRADGAVLLIGGDDVVPHFRLPNPADDDDAEILTDNPYGTAPNGSCFVPSLPIGRIVDGYGGNMSMLLRQLDNLVEARREALIQPIGRGLVRVGRVALGALGLGRARPAALACVAADREAVGALVVGALPPSGMIKSCPPVDPGSFDLRWLAEYRCQYYDVSGTPDGDRWYGRPARDPENGAWQAPVAFSADNLAEAHLRSPVIFTTAGYAARFAAESSGSSLALRFLADGAAALVGASASTYGATAPPLAGADLLASLFWRSCQEGYPVGEALRLAQSSFAQIELERQGYLDGDDQKTLLEFGVYGDPLFRVFDGDATEDRPPDLAVRIGDCLCKDVEASGSAVPLDRRLVREALQFITAQHPELETGTMRVQTRVPCRGECGRAAHGGMASPSAELSMTTFVTARSAIGAATPAGVNLVRIARATLDAEGQVVKLVVSR